MSNYDDALSLIENEVNRDCEYYVYSQLRDCIDTIEDDCKLLESENAKLRELCKAWYKFSYELFDEFIGEPELNEDFMALDDRLRKLGLEVE